jgi:hypothetical protein
MGTRADEYLRFVILFFFPRDFSNQALIFSRVYVTLRYSIIFFFLNNYRTKKKE